MAICNTVYQLNSADIFILLFHLYNFHPQMDISFYLIQIETCHILPHFSFFTFSYLLFISSQEFYARVNKYIWHFRIRFQWNVPDSSISSPLIYALPYPQHREKKETIQSKIKLYELVK